MGRQTAQPRPAPVPCAATTSVKVSWPPSSTSLYSSAREWSKCSHSARETSMPLLASSWFSSFVSDGTQEPHTVPAVVHSLIAPIVWQPCSLTAWRTVPAETLLHEQITASSGISAPASASPAPSGAITAEGSAPSARPVIGRSCEYSAMSPTNTPPSRVVASSLITSLRYWRWTGSTKETSSASGVMALTSPNAAASTPTPLSFVPSSARWWVRVPPRKRSTTTSAMSLPGAISPAHTPSKEAHSPIAQMSGSEVWQLSPTTIPPRSPTARPASRPMRSRGRMPVENTTTSAGISLPSVSSAVPIAPSSAGRNAVAPTPVRTSMPLSSMSRRSISPPPSSSWTAMSRSANSTTVASAPRPCRAAAASRPSTPPPTTTPLTGRPSLSPRSATQAASDSTSSTVR